MDLADEAIAVAAVFLTIIRMIGYIFFQKCKNPALIKPIKVDSTNHHDYPADKIAKPVMLVEKNQSASKIGNIREILVTTALMDTKKNSEFQ